MTRLPPRPQLSWVDPDVPRALDADDVYFSGDGLKEKQAVFLTGCGLPEAWAGRESFAIGELGFGVGLAFLAVWDAWRRCRPSQTARLHFLSFEKALVLPSDAALVHARWPQLRELSDILTARWPERARGVQRIRLPDGVVLTLVIDDVAAALPEIDGAIDAWFLDGFAPSKNPEMWSSAALQEIARLSADDARLASYSVAGELRRNLAVAGFAATKKPGVGRKAERLEAVLAPRARPLRAPRPPRRVLVIGAGVAGASAARAFLARGCEVVVLDSGFGVGTGASGNEIALVMPRLDAGDGPVARGLIEAYLFARRTWLDLGPEAAVALEALRLPKNDAEPSRFSRLLEDPPLEPPHLAPLDPAAYGQGLRHGGAVAVRPRLALPALMAGAEFRFNATATALIDADGKAFARLDTGEKLEADLIVVCAGMGLDPLLGARAPKLQGRLGQLEQGPMSGATPNARADGGYVVQAFDTLAFGATFEPAPPGPTRPTLAARAMNLETLHRLRPDLAAGALDAMASRASVRATTPDRLPLAGPALEAPQGGRDPSDRGSILMIGGLGARGYLWAPFLAEILASEVFDEPRPMERRIGLSLQPDRFARRERKRSG